MSTALTATAMTATERRESKRKFDELMAYANSFDKGGKWQKRRKAKVDNEMELWIGSTRRNPQKEDQDTSIGNF